MAFSKKPSKPPTFPAADFAKALDEIAQKVLGKTIFAFGPDYFPKWKRYVESTSEYDTIGIRDVVNANAYGLDALKSSHDVLDDRESIHYQEFKDFKAAIEAQQGVPFPGSG